MQNKIIFCPNCNEKIYFNFDEWGKTSIHLHCNKCNINIGVDSFKKCEELLEKYHKKNTTLEYYFKKLQYLSEEGKIVMNEE